MKRNIFIKIYDFIVYDIRVGIRNLIRYFKIVWKDRDWDQYFIFKLLHFKLKSMEKAHRNYGYDVRSNEKADEMKLCVLLLDRLIKDEYLENVFLNHDKKWGDLEIDLEETDEYFRDEDKEQLSECIITRPNIKTKEDEKQERKEYRILSKKVDEQQKQDINMLFEKMKKQILDWWD